MSIGLTDSGESMVARGASQAAGHIRIHTDMNSA